MIAQCCACVFIRYHEIYSEVVPDLRENRKTGKKLWFNGYHTHSNIYRGLVQPDSTRTCASA